MEREPYLMLLRDLLSGEPARVREANRTVYRDLVLGGDVGEAPSWMREADLVLAEVP